MSEYSLGTAKGAIEIAYKGDGPQQAQKDLAATGASAKKVSPALAKSGKIAGIAGLAIGAGFAVAVKSAADFEQRMSAVQAVSGANERQIGALRDKALQLGKDTQFSASESASAIEELVKAGISVPDVLNGAADAVVNLAAAGEVSMPEAASIASNAMNQFGLSAKDMNGVVNNIAGAANASAIDVSEFGQSLSQVGAVAHLSGVDFDDTATAIALMGNAGIKGSDAGTSLKTMFSRLNPSTEAATNEMKKLGLMTKMGNNHLYDQQGNLKDLSTVSGMLQKSMKGMTAEQKQATLQTIFGSDAIRAAAVLTDQGSKGFDKMAASMGKVSAADVAKARMDNFAGSLEQLKGSLETVGITIGSMLLGPLRSVTDAVTSFLNNFLSLPGVLQGAITAFIGLVGVVLLIFAAVVKFIQIQKAVQLALAGTRLAFISTWAAALGPIALVIAAVLAVVAIIVLLWKKNETFRAAVIAVWNKIKSAVAAVVAWFQSNVLPTLQKVWSGVVQGAREMWSMLRSIWKLIVAVVRLYMTAISAVVRAVWSKIGGFVKGYMNLIKGFIQGGWAIIKGVVKGAVLAVAAVIRATFGTIVAVIKGAVKIWWSVIKAVWETIKTVIRTATQVINAVIRGDFGAIPGILRDAFGQLAGIARDLMGNVLDAVKGVWSDIKGAFSGAGQMLYDAGKAVVQGLIDGIKAMVGAVGSAIASVVQTVKDHMPGSPVKKGPLTVLNKGYAGKQIVRMVVGGMEDMKSPIEATMNHLLKVPDVTRDFDRIHAASRVAVDTAPRASRSFDRASAGMGTQHRSRLVEGRLSLDERGRAFIRGVAEDVYEGNDRFAHAHGRMG